MSESKLGAWQTLSRTELLRREPWLAVHAERVRLPDGRVVPDFHQIELPDTAVVLAVEARRMLFLRQYKHGAGRVSLTLPGGALGRGEDPLEGARRELQEETGYRAERWEKLGAFVNNGTYRCGQEHLFWAEGLERVSAPDSGDLEEAELTWRGAAELRAALQAGEIPIMGVVMAVLMFLEREARSAV